MSPAKIGWIIQPLIVCDSKITLIFDVFGEKPENYKYIYKYQSF